MPCYDRTLAHKSAFCRLHRRSLPYLIEDRDQLVYLLGLEHTFRSSWADVCKGGLIEGAGLHDSMFSQVVDNQIDEFDLVRGRRLPDEKSTERLLGCLSIQAYERPNKDS